jgi:hypothetical protein
MLTPNAIEILRARYLKRNREGVLTEDPEAMFRRVARAIAGARTIAIPRTGAVAGTGTVVIVIVVFAAAHPLGRVHHIAKIECRSRAGKQ